jgi:hypothetical protein
LKILFNTCSLGRKHILKCCLGIEKAGVTNNEIPIVNHEYYIEAKETGTSKEQNTSLPQT